MSGRPGCQPQVLLTAITRIAPDSQIKRLTSIFRSPASLTWTPPPRSLPRFPSYTKKEFTSPQKGTPSLNISGYWKFFFILSQNLFLSGPVFFFFSPLELGREMKFFKNLLWLWSISYKKVHAAEITSLINMSPSHEPPSRPGAGTLPSPEVPPPPLGLSLPLTQLSLPSWLFKVVLLAASPSPNNGVQFCLCANCMEIKAWEFSFVTFHSHFVSKSCPWCCLQLDFLVV